VIYKEISTNANGNRVILNIYPMMKGEKKKVDKPTTNASNQGKRSVNTTKNPTIKKRSAFGTPIN